MTLLEKETNLKPGGNQIFCYLLLLISYSLGVLGKFSIYKTCEFGI